MRKADRIVLSAALLLAALGLAAMSRGFDTNGAISFFGGLVVLILCLGTTVYVTQRNRIPWLPQLCLGLTSVLLVFGLVELATALHDALRPRPVIGVEALFRGYDEARANRAGFRRFWKVHHRRWAILDSDLFVKTRGPNPYRLVPGARVMRGTSELRVNQLGFRGPEISTPKGERFRIVALGESTTFGLTVRATDRTWPAVLEQLIADELTCDVPIEVINAGVGGWTLANQNSRLSSDVLPLEPDLLLSYHGQNGFAFFLARVPGLAFATFPPLEPRPSRILSIVERELQLRPLRADQPNVSGINTVSQSEAELLASPYAAQYRRLVASARLAGVDVALGTFNLAVNADSPEEAIRFYEAMFPDVRSRIIANQLHTRIVRQLGKRAKLLVIDTSPGLDGAYRDSYVDLVHFTQRGRDRLAANMLTGLRGLLRSHPRLNCRARLRAAGRQNASSDAR